MLPGRWRAGPVCNVLLVLSPHRATIVRRPPSCAERKSALQPYHRRPKRRLRQLCGSAPAPLRACALQHSSCLTLRLRFNLPQPGVSIIRAAPQPPPPKPVAAKPKPKPAQVHSTPRFYVHHAQPGLRYLRRKELVGPVQLSPSRARGRGQLGRPFRSAEAVRGRVRGNYLALQWRCDGFRPSLPGLCVSRHITAGAVSTTARRSGTPDQLIESTSP